MGRLQDAAKRLEIEMPHTRETRYNFKFDCAPYMFLYDFNNCHGQLSLLKMKNSGFEETARLIDHDEIIDAFYKLDNRVKFITLRISHAEGDKPGVENFTYMKNGNDWERVDIKASKYMPKK